MANIKYLDKEFDKFWQKIKMGENFALTRNGDGERAVMSGSTLKAQEGGWKFPDYICALGKDCSRSLLINNDKFFYGISCPCCDEESYYWYRSRINTKNITFANLWINGNYTKFKENFNDLKRDSVLITNYRAANHQIANLNILKHYTISDDCITFWETDAKKMLSQIKYELENKNNILYVVSAGPIIAELFKNNPNNCYIDFGSAIEPYYNNSYFKRPYMIAGTIYNQRNCWMHDENESFDVSVVLNLLKKL
ncbi:MAG: hypothetical protein LBD61_01425 [Endomicrobium sp.]|jgi:hypothetical protein|nr:hypothetical protein [Endomicrobium sp.]